MNAPLVEQPVVSGADLVMALLNKALRAQDRIALDFMAVNDSHVLAPYRQAALWIRGFGIVAISGVASVEQNAPYVQWLKPVCAQMPSGNARPVSAPDLSVGQSEHWAEWLPAYGLWVPICLPGQGENLPVGGLIFARDQAWTEQEQAILREWLAAWTLVRHSVAPFVRVNAIIRRLSGIKRVRLIAILAAVSALFVIHVPITILAPGELVAIEPMPVRAPIDGVVREFFVKPNQSVKAGDRLFAFDILQLASKLEVANQALHTAQAELRQYDQQALNDPKARAALAAARGNVAEKRAELDYLRNQRGRSLVLAAEEGIAIFDDAQEWIGKPVSTGERILRIASDQRKGIEAWIAVGDAIPLPPRASTRLYLTSSPLDPVAGTVYYLAHEAVRRPDGTYAFRVRASLDQPTEHRIGLKGTVRLSGESVSLAYWMFRRPLAAVREFLGI